eukprot:c8976_g2_i1 orf=2-2311(-)
MLAGCTAFQSYHRQCGQLRMNVTAAAAQPASPPPYGLAHHLFQHQHQHCILESQHDRSRNYELFGKEVSFNSEKGEGEGEEVTGAGADAQKGSSHDELAKLVTPFLSVGKNKHSTSQSVDRLTRSESYGEMVAVSLQRTKLEVIMGDPEYHLMEFTGSRPGEICQGRGLACKGVGEQEDKKEWATCSWNDHEGAEQNSGGQSVRVDEELAPWFMADGPPTALLPGEYLEGLWGEHVQLPLAMNATPASSMSSVHVLGEGASLGGGETTTASVRGSCSPSSVALNAESPSSVPSSSTLMLSPPPSSASVMVQQDSPALAAPVSSRDLFITSNSPSNNNSMNGTLPRSTRELFYAATCVNNGNMSPLSLTLPKSLSFSGLPPSLFPANVGFPSLVQQQSLLKMEQHREESIELVDLLVACVEAITAGSLTFINHLLARLGKLASPSGSSMHRLAAYFTEGLACRVSKMWPHIYQPLLPSTVPPEGLAQQNMAGMRGCEGLDGASAWQVLNHATPLVKFSHFTANEMILQAFEGEERVHVIDLDIKQGLQWPALFHCLANRRGGPPRQVRVTGIGECKEEVQDAGDRLAEFAEEVGLKMEFHGVVDKLEDVRLWMLHVKAEPREAVAINCILQLHHTLHDESGTAVRNLLSLIHSTHPKVVALVEQEADCHDHPTLQARFSNALRYFAALFDALDATLPASSPARFKVETHFAAHIHSILACDGSQWRERYQPLRCWQDLLTPAGFRCIPLSHRTRLQAHILLRMFSSPATSS